MNMSTKQAGFSFMSLMLWFIIGGFAILLGMKLGPPYMENATIQSILNDLKEQKATTGLLSPKDVRGHLDKQLLINGIRRFDSQDDLSVKRVDDNIVVEYEVREHIVANIDVVIAFSNTVAIPLQQ